ncbi:MAG: AAA family ATPase [Candidatus Heimdallarchaeota archaeon]|nr:AAA family ATPase [Candidatus Heimdallarchaeota archaeon]
METIRIDDVELSLSSSTILPVKWIGQNRVMNQLLASWMVLEESDVPLTPRIIGPPGVGKTTMAYAAAQSLGKETYFYQCTMDTRPEDLLITPVIAENQQIRYVASPLVSAMIRGGVLILDEGNRMSEKSWASLAPLLDQRRYIESQIAGIKVQAHDDFRMVVTMNADASTFELPEYIISRLQPIIDLDFPSAEEERQILKVTVPFAPEQLVELVVQFLQAAHSDVKPYTIRAGIQIVQYTLKLQKITGDAMMTCLYTAVQQILGDDALDYM